jgi:hypothetical protein
MQSAFGAVQVFVTASVNETTTSFEYGKITTLATGTQNQQTIGPADFGQIAGNQVTIRLSLEKVNAAVGNDVTGSTSTNTQARSQILIGSSLSGGLLLNSDQAAGADFPISGSSDPAPTPTPDATPTPTPEPTPSASPTPDPTPTPSATPTPAPTPEPTPAQNPGGPRFDERYSGTLNVGQSYVDIRFELRRSFLDAQINRNQGNQTIYFELLDRNGDLIATAEQRKITRNGLPPGTYIYRVRGNVSTAVDFTIMSGQGR